MVIISNNKKTLLVLLLVSGILISLPVASAFSLSDFFNSFFGSLRIITGMGGGEIPADCGNGVIDGGEICDPNAKLSESCEGLGYAGGLLRCADDCKSYDTSLCYSECGNGILEETEECDGDDFGGKDCQYYGWSGGELACTSECRIDQEGCTDGPVCGDGTCDAGETCSGCPNDCEWQQADCVEGEICEVDAFGFGSCVEVQSAVCGDGKIGGDEVCDFLGIFDNPDELFLNGETCKTQGFDAGTLKCSSDCLDFDTSECYNEDDSNSGGNDGSVSSNCGNGNLDDGEICEIVQESSSLALDGSFEVGRVIGYPEMDSADKGAVVVEVTCETLGYEGGTLGCSGDCSGFDVSGCYGSSDEDSASGGAQYSARSCAGVGGVCSNECSADYRYYGDEKVDEACENAFPDVGYDLVCCVPLGEDETSESTSNSESSTDSGSSNNQDSGNSIADDLAGLFEERRDVEGSNVGRSPSGSGVNMVLERVFSQPSYVVGGLWIVYVLFVFVILISYYLHDRFKIKKISRRRILKRRKRGGRR